MKKEIKITEEKTSNIEGRQRRHNICVIDSLKKKKESMRIGQILNIKYFLKSNKRVLKIHIERSHYVPKEIKSQWLKPRYILTKLLNLREVFGHLGKLHAQAFLQQFFYSRRKWNNMYKILMERKFEPRIYLQQSVCSSIQMCYQVFFKICCQFARVYMFL